MKKILFRRLFFLPLIVVLVGLACNRGETIVTTPTRDPGWIETARAATQTASSPVIDTPEAPTVEPTAPVATISPTAGTEPPAATEPAATAQPDALRVAYAKDSAVWLWTEGGAAQKLTSGEQRIEQVNLSPDGEWVAYIRLIDDLHMELWVVKTDGTGERVLLDTAALNALDPAADGVALYEFDWVPGAHSIAFNTRQVFDGPGLVLYDDVRLVDVSTGDLSVLLPPGQGGMFYYSPDGSRIAVVTPTQIHIVNSDGGGRVEAFYYASVITYSEYQYYAQPFWSSDSQRLRVVIPPADPLADPALMSGIWMIPADGSAPPAHPGNIQTMSFLFPPGHFSPDHSLLAYVKPSGDPSLSLGELHLANADGSADGIFTIQPFLTFLGWSIDGQRYIFSTGEQADTHVARLDGTVVTLPKTPGQRIMNLQWISSDRILYSVGSFESGGWELILAEIDDAMLVPVDTGIDPAYSFDWAR